MTVSFISKFEINVMNRNKRLCSIEYVILCIFLAKKNSDEEQLTSENEIKLG